MTSLNTPLWERIKAHKMPADATGRSFTDQLMADHRITRDTAQVAIEEYRKFMYLCATRAERNVPSKAVDLVWHLHMQHSRDYWDVFCKTLGKPVHHTPGGEGTAHLSDYKATVVAYRALFGTPPKGIWRQSRKNESLTILIIGAVAFYQMSGTMAEQGFEVGRFLGLLISSAMIGFSLYSLTPQAEFSLVFEDEDPFADDDAGDCGSGDGGGCGD